MTPGTARHRLDRPDRIGQIFSVGDVVAPATTATPPRLDPCGLPARSPEALHDLNFGAAELATIADHTTSALIAVLGHGKEWSLPELEFERHDDELGVVAHPSSRRGADRT